jgi:hypothetical protein
VVEGLRLLCMARGRPGTESFNLNLKTAVAGPKMAHLVKSTKDFEIFGAQPWHRQGEHQKFKSRSDFSQLRHFGPP